MIRKFYIPVILFLGLTISLSCSNSASFKANVTGKAGEVILVIDEADWQSDLGPKLRKILLADYPGLPQKEPKFDLVNIPKKAFTSIFKTHRNVIFIDISSQFNNSQLTVKEDVNASPQTIVTISGPNRQAISVLLDEKEQLLVDVFENAERQRIINNYKKYEVRDIREKLEKDHDLSMFFPKGYNLDLDTTDFHWISYETPQISQGVFVYYYDYLDTSDFNIVNLLKVRDSLLQKYVPGPMPGSYMTTEQEYEKPTISQFLLNDKYVAEIRGLWKVEGDFMGGPFVSISTVDEKRNRLITAEAYVFAPKFDKRNYLRQVEAILYTLDFLQKE